MTDNILKPCPFCGNSVKLSKWEHRGQQYYSVGCGCDVMMKSNPSCGQGWLRQEDAVKCWNTRDDKETTNIRETVNAIQDKKRIAEYMGWQNEYGRRMNFDLNDAGLCVAEMQKRGDWQKFCATGFGIYFETERPSHVFPENYIAFLFPENYIAFLFNADNFFAAFAKWLKEGDGV